MEELETSPQGVSPEPEPAPPVEAVQHRPNEDAAPATPRLSVDELMATTRRPVRRRSRPRLAGRLAAQSHSGSHRLCGRGTAHSGANRGVAAAARGAHQGPARPVDRRIRPARPRRLHPRSGRRLQDGHQAGTSRGGAQFRQEPEAAAEALAAGAGDPGRDRLQAARHRPGDHGDPRRAGRRRAQDAAGPQTDRRRRTQERHRQADAVQNHQGVPDPVRPEGPQRAALAQGIRRDPPHGLLG